jgi:hypothetical protein
MKGLNQNQETWVSSSAFKQGCRNHFWCMLYEAGQNAQKCQKLEERIVEKGARQRARVLGLYIDAFRQPSLREQYTAWLKSECVQFYAARLSEKLERRWNRLSKFRQLFFGLTPLSRISKTLSGENPDETTDLRVGKNAEIAQRLVAGLGEFPQGRGRAPELLKKTSRGILFGASNARITTGLAAARNISLNCSGSQSRTSFLPHWWHETDSAKTKVRLVSARPRRQPTFDQQPLFYSLAFFLTP